MALLVGRLELGVLLEPSGLSLSEDLDHPDGLGLALHGERREIPQPEAVADLSGALLGHDHLA